MKRQRYNAEFKREAARLMIMDGLSAPEVSKRLDVNTGLLYRWKRDHLAELDASSPPGSKSSPTQMAAEIDQLRKADKRRQVLTLDKLGLERPSNQQISSIARQNGGPETSQSCQMSRPDIFLQTSVKCQGAVAQIQPIDYQ